MWEAFEQAVYELFQTMFGQERLERYHFTENQAIDFKIDNQFLVEVKFYRSATVSPNLIENAIFQLNQAREQFPNAQQYEIILVVSALVPTALKEQFSQQYTGLTILDRDNLLDLAQRYGFYSEKLTRFFDMPIRHLAYA